MPELDITHLSIGEVLRLLLDEFPDITISKIRFLESQGLINPERTPSGYRKFYPGDVDLLRCVLHEQKENFLPLKVIKERLDTGQIDPTSEIRRPRGSAGAALDGADDRGDEDKSVVTKSVVTKELMSTFSHPAAGRGATASTSLDVANPQPSEHGRDLTIGDISATSDRANTLLQSGVRLNASEIVSMAGITAEQLESLGSYGLVIADAADSYDEDALEVARVAKRFLDLGVEARHLRGWRVAADREAGLLEQIIQPLIRQRNPQSSEQAAAQMIELEQLGAQMRSALMRTLLRQHFDG